MYIFRFCSQLRQLLNVASICVLLCIVVAGCQHNEPLQKPMVASAVATAPKLTPPQSREAKIAAAIERAIASPAPAGYAPIPAGTKLLGVDVIGSKIRLNFTKALLLNGTGRKLEDAVKQLTNPISDLTADIANVEYQLLIEGKPLAEVL
jgi:hypothetical protein